MRGAIFAAALAALGGALWASLAGSGCRDCQDSRTLLAGWPLAGLGVAFYALLCLLTGWGKLPAWTQAAAFAAAGVHLALLFVLYRQRTFCPPCLFTAAAAVSCAALTLALRRPRGTAVACLLLGVSLSAWALRASAPDAPAPPLPAVLPGHVRLLVYERPECYECAMLESQMVPRLQDKMGDSLTIVRLAAAEGMQTPTLVVEGQSARTLTGLPSFNELEQIVIDARETNH